MLRTSAKLVSWPSAALSQNLDSVVTNLLQRNETVSVAETSSGGLISASLLTRNDATAVFKGSGVRLPMGISTVAQQKATKAVEEYLQVHWGGETPSNKLQNNDETSLGWKMVYLNEEDANESSIGTAVHALELAHAAKINLKTHWGIGESGFAETHHRTGDPAGLCYVAVAGPTKETTGVLRLSPRGEGEGGGMGEHMVRFTEASIDLMQHLQKQRK